MCRDVALRKESVDRNVAVGKGPPVAGKSLSERRAWIEIVRACCSALNLAVALRKESVDRNTEMRVALDDIKSRSPQGERG